MLTCKNIVNNLSGYLSLLKSVKWIVTRSNHPRVVDEILIVPSITLEYKTVKMLLHSKKGLDDYPQLYFQAVFQVSADHGVLKDVYCVDKAIEDEFKNSNSNTISGPGIKWQDDSETNIYSDEVNGYLEISDRIAQQCYLCTSGDDYYPGYFSSTIVTEESITLKQINLHNSRSINHKSDYHMRELIIMIPTIQNYHETSFSDYKIGGMRIKFSDRSSAGNTVCGEKITQRIAAEKSAFENSK